MERPLPRQMGCPECGHDHLWLACDWCLCDAHEQTGVYPTDAVEV